MDHHVKTRHLSLAFFIVAICIIIAAVGGVCYGILRIHPSYTATAIFRTHTPPVEEEHPIVALERAHDFAIYMTQCSRNEAAMQRVIQEEHLPLSISAALNATKITRVEKTVLLRVNVTLPDAEIAEQIAESYPKVLFSVLQQKALIDTHEVEFFMVQHAQVTASSATWYSFALKMCVIGAIVGVLLALVYLCWAFHMSAWLKQYIGFFKQTFLSAYHSFLKTAILSSLAGMMAAFALLHWILPMKYTTSGVVVLTVNHFEQYENSVALAQANESLVNSYVAYFQEPFLYQAYYETLSDAMKQQYTPKELQKNIIAEVQSNFLISIKVTANTPEDAMYLADNFSEYAFSALAEILEVGEFTSKEQFQKYTSQYAFSQFVIIPVGIACFVMALLIWFLIWLSSNPCKKGIDQFREYFSIFVIGIIPAIEQNTTEDSAIQ